MSKNKLRKFAELAQIPFVFERPYSTLTAGNGGFDLRGRWHEHHFANANPIFLELGCGRGEYTVGLAERHADLNCIGIDIKGARMHAGATRAQQAGMRNVAFVRTSIEFLPAFFAPAEVAEIWLTFPDPQMQKTRKRLTSARFIDLYRQVLKPSGYINLKTDSPFLYEYTRQLCQANPGVLTLEADVSDVYNTSTPPADIDIRTAYEQQWLGRGLTIKHLRIRVGQGPITEIDDSAIARDTYRSFSRGHVDPAKQNI